MQSYFYKQEQSVTKFGKGHSQIIFNIDVWVWSFIVHINESLVLIGFH